MGRGGHPQCKVASRLLLSAGQWTVNQGGKPESYPVRLAGASAADLTAPRACYRDGCARGQRSRQTQTHCEAVDFSAAFETESSGVRCAMLVGKRFERSERNERSMV